MVDIKKKIVGTTPDKVKIKMDEVKKGKVKIQIAVAKGKKQYDKRHTKKTKDWNRDKARYFRKSS